MSETIWKITGLSHARRDPFPALKLRARCDSHPEETRRRERTPREGTRVLNLAEIVLVARLFAGPQQRVGELRGRTFTAPQGEVTANGALGALVRRAKRRMIGSLPLHVGGIEPATLNALDADWPELLVNFEIWTMPKERHDRVAAVEVVAVTRFPLVDRLSKRELDAKWVYDPDAGELLGTYPASQSTGSALSDLAEHGSLTGCSLINLLHLVIDGDTVID